MIQILKNKKIKLNMSKVPRWVQLYNYSKQLNKSKELKSLNASKNNIEVEISECTFHPITHFTHVLHTKKRTSHEILNSLNERHNTWNNIRTKKIKSIYIQKENKEYNNFSFCPNIQRDMNYFTNVNKKTEEVVLDPESYNLYINQRKKYIDSINTEKKKRQLTPGSGKIWRETPTKVKEFIFETDKKYKRNKSYKDITRSKIKLLTLNTLKEKSKNDSEKYMIIHSESNKNENTIENIKQKLHNELHKLKL